MTLRPHRVDDQGMEQPLSGLARVRLDIPTMKYFLCLGGLVALTLSTSLADTAPSPDPTNSANNATNGPTALDQSNTQADVKITAKIRRHVTKDERLSVDAKNVKIITSGGKVILTGPVDSAEEQRIVREHAEKAVGAANVTDQTTVK